MWQIHCSLKHFSWSLFFFQPFTIMFLLYTRLPRRIHELVVIICRCLSENFHCSVSWQTGYQRNMSLRVRTCCYKKFCMTGGEYCLTWETYNSFNLFCGKSGHNNIIWVTSLGSFLSLYTCSECTEGTYTEQSTDMATAEATVMRRREGEGGREREREGGGRETEAATDKGCHRENV